MKRVLEEGPALTNARRKLNLKKIQRQSLALKFSRRKNRNTYKATATVEASAARENLLLWRQLMEQTGFSR